MIRIIPARLTGVVRGTYAPALLAYSEDSTLRGTPTRGHAQ